MRLLHKTDKDLNFKRKVSMEKIQHLGGRTFISTSCSAERLQQYKFTEMNAASTATERVNIWRLSSWAGYKNGSHISLKKKKKKSQTLHVDVLSNVCKEHLSAEYVTSFFPGSLSARKWITMKNNKLSKSPKHCQKRCLHYFSLSKCQGELILIFQRFRRHQLQPCN